MQQFTATQSKALRKFQDNMPHSAYDVQASLATLRALVKKGILRDVTTRGPGGMFSPLTHYQFKLVRNVCNHIWANDWVNNQKSHGLIDQCFKCGEERA